MRKQPIVLLIFTACLGVAYALFHKPMQLSNSVVPANIKTKPVTSKTYDSSESIEANKPITSEGSVEVMNLFQGNIQKIDDCLFERMYQKSYKENCSIPVTQLRYVTVSYYGFDNKVHTGELVVNKQIAKKIICIFQELFDIKYPIEKVVLIDDYDADDNASMEDNNSSSFNYRMIDGTNRLSNHSQGLAIDINPLYNPYVRCRDGELSVLPESGKDYVDRDGECIYMIKKNDACYNIFIKYGFTWGGDWTSSKDYQHFEYKGEA